MSCVFLVVFGLLSVVFVIVFVFVFVDHPSDDAMKHFGSVVVFQNHFSVLLLPKKKLFFVTTVMKKNVMMNTTMNDACVASFLPMHPTQDQVMSLHLCQHQKKSNGSSFAMKNVVAFVVDHHLEQQ